MPVMIYNKQYKTVAERLNEASKVIKSIKTEVLYIEPVVMVKATVETEKGIFTGTSAANPKKSIEASAPVEVAETSAVGRALAFAGYAGSEIASAEEMQKAMTPQKASKKQRDLIIDLMRRKAVTIEQVRTFLGINNQQKMTLDQASKTIKWLNEKEDVEPKGNIN